MDREIRTTSDGSHTLYVKSMDECYHSVHGALQESTHVFINQGLKHTPLDSISILELGFGTGLNALLTLADATQSGLKIAYHAVEKYPLDADEYSRLNFETFIEGLPKGSFQRLHTLPWEKEHALGPQFRFYKEQSDFRSMAPKGTFDLVYFDAFDPNKQPELWTEAIFSRLYALMNAGGILVTYSSKGLIRRAMKASGFEVFKVPGPPGKREMVRAIKP